MKNLKNNNKFVKKNKNLTDFSLEIEFKSVFIGYVSKFEKFSNLSFDNPQTAKSFFSWDLFYGSQVDFSNKIFFNNFIEKLKNIFIHIRNYNSHTYHKKELEIFFSKEDKEENSLSKIIKSQTIINFLYKLLEKTKEKNTFDIHYWLLIFIYSSLVFYCWEYRQIKNEIKNIFTNIQKKYPNNKKISEISEIWNSNLDDFEDLNFQIVKRLPFEEENQEMISIINEIVRLYDDQEKKDNFIYEKLSRISLKKIVLLFECLLNSADFFKKKKLQINLKIKVDFYCSNCSKSDNQNYSKKLVSVEHFKKNNEKMLVFPFNIICSGSYDDQCQKKLQSNKNEEFNKWFFNKNSSKHYIRKNFFIFFLENYFIKISFKTFKTLFLKIFLVGFQKGKKTLDMEKIVDQLWIFFEKIKEKNVNSFTKRFFSKIESKNTHSLRFTEEEIKEFQVNEWKGKEFQLFKNYDFIKKYQLKEKEQISEQKTESKWKKYDFFENFFLLKFIYNRKLLYKHKLEKFISNLEKRNFSEKDKRNYDNLNNLTKTGKNKQFLNENSNHKEIGLRLKLILNFINFYIQSSDIENAHLLILKEKDYQDIYEWVFDKIWKKKLEFKLIKYIFQVLKKKQKFFSFIKIFGEDISDYEFDNLLLFLLKNKIKFLKKDLSLLANTIKEKKPLLKPKIEKWITDYKASLFKNLEKNSVIKINHQWLLLYFSDQSSLLAKQVKNIWPLLQSKYPDEVLKSIKTKKNFLEDDFRKKYDLLFRFFSLIFWEKHFFKKSKKILIFNKDEKNENHFTLEFDKTDNSKSILKWKVHLKLTNLLSKKIIVFENWKDWRNKSYLLTFWFLSSSKNNNESKNNFFQSLEEKYKDKNSIIPIQSLKEHWYLTFSKKDFPKVDELTKGKKRNTIMKFLLKKEKEIIEKFQISYDNKNYIKFEEIIEKSEFKSQKKDLCKARNYLMHNDFLTQEKFKETKKILYIFLEKYILWKKK